jgi:hypothetical protein
MANRPKVTSSAARDNLQLQEFVLLETRQSALSLHGLQEEKDKVTVRTFLEKRVKQECDGV